MTALPTHVALGDEAIPVPCADPFAGPDMRGVAPIEQMLTWLDEVAEDATAYTALWIALVDCVGCRVHAHYDRDGSLGLMMSSPVDVQVRHRSRWMHFLLGHLDAIEGRREVLQSTLTAAGRLIDERSAKQISEMAA